MIKKTILITVSLFLIYTIFVNWFAPKWWSASQHQWQDNIIKAQNFIYNDKDLYDNIIVGSSLSCRLIMDSIPQVYNLSFAGQSIFDGLNILTHINEPPKNIFIEMNVVLRWENENFTSSLNSILYYPKKVLLSLREDKQPIGIIGYQIRYPVTARIIGYPKSFLETNKDTSKEQLHDNELFSKSLAMQTEAYSVLPSDLILKESFDKLKKYLDILEAKNINVIFFEVPINNQLNNSPKAQLIRQTFYKKFPQLKYKYVSIPTDSEKYITTDGIHLSNEEALKYTIYLKSKIEFLQGNVK